MYAVVPRSPAVSRTAAALVGAGDPESTRLVYAMVIGLVVVGIALLLLGVWIIRQTRPDLEVLAPLERMGDSDWKKRDQSTQRRMLDEVRPDGAQPLVAQKLPPPLDAEFEQAEHPVPSFSDLGPGVPSQERDPTPPGGTEDLLEELAAPSGDPLAAPNGDGHAAPAEADALPPSGTEQPAEIVDDISPDRH